MPETRPRMSRLTDRAAGASDPLAALRTLRELRSELEELEHERVAEALRDGSSFGAVARALGISRQAAHRRYRELAPPHEPLPLASQTRRALDLAYREAAAMGRPLLGSEHLLLGVLRSGGGTSRALEAEGLTAQRVSDCVVAGPANGPLEPRAVMDEAEQIARARHATSVGPDHLVLAALNAGDGGAQRAITALGVQAAAVRGRLGC